MVSYVSFIYRSMVLHDYHFIIYCNVYMVFLECHVIIIVQGHTLCPVMEGWRNSDPWWTQAIGPYGVACCVISVETWRGHQCLNYLLTACNTQTCRERNLSMLANARTGVNAWRSYKNAKYFLSDMFDLIVRI